MVSEDVLIIKAGYSEFLEEETNSRRVSLGDVLRTTPLLHAYKGDRITWATDEGAFPLLQGNPYIDRILKLDWITCEQLKKERFDVIINLEKVPGISCVSEDIYAVKRFGFRFDPTKRKAEVYDKAYEALAVGTDPLVKRKNKKTFQELLFGVVGRNWDHEKYILGYKPHTKEKYDVALNTQVGEKWPTKAWGREKWDCLEDLLTREGFKVTRQEKQDPAMLKSLNDYMDWLNSSRLIITNDSLGLHLGFALEKKVLGLFGATPVSEIYFYGLGKAIMPSGKFNCIPCFMGHCNNDRFCMDSINPKKVASEAKILLAR